MSIKGFIFNTQIIMKNFKLSALPTIIGHMVLVVVLFSSCQKMNEKCILDNTNDLKDYQIVIIDDCEYIKYKAAGKYNYITHKGNCRFCEYRRANSK